ncbi:hypothetical protein ASD64_17795 [Mesorhizobium sp. Root157]|nr:hypothetical protein ASD64_17795 [Mesorhizobium sp. Root157]
MLDEGRDLPLEIAWQEVVFEQDAVLERLVPALDLALGLRVKWRSADMAHAVGVDPLGEFGGDVGRAVAPTEGREGTAETTVRAAFRCRRAPVEVAMASQGFSRM